MFILSYFAWKIIISIKFKKENLSPAILKKKFEESFTVTGLCILFLLHPNIIQTTFGMFQCVNLGDDTTSAYYLKSDLQFECWTPIHFGWVFGLGLPSLLLWGIKKILIL